MVFVVGGLALVFLWFEIALHLETQLFKDLRVINVGSHQHESIDGASEFRMVLLAELITQLDHSSDIGLSSLIKCHSVLAANTIPLHLLHHIIISGLLPRHSFLPLVQGVSNALVQ